MIAERRRLAALASVAVLALAGCGADDEAGEEAEPVGVGQVQVGSVAPLAQCRDWNAGTEEKRLATVDDIREQINLEDGPVRTPALTDEEAIEVFDNSCEPPQAATIRLYTLYARAAGFQSLLDH